MVSSAARAVGDIAALSAGPKILVSRFPQSSRSEAFLRRIFGPASFPGGSGFPHLGQAGRGAGPPLRVDKYQRRDGKPIEDANLVLSGQDGRLRDTE